MRRISPSQKGTNNEGILNAIRTVFREFEPHNRLVEAREADTRVKLIDKILELVGWNMGDIAREVPTPSGTFIDYELCRGQQPHMVVEAKRVDRTFALGELTRRGVESRTRSIGTLFSHGGKDLREAFSQAAGYCNDRGIALAAVTNGYQWVFFQGLSSRGRSWNRGHAVVFADPQDIEDRLDDFLQCVGSQWVGSSRVFELLQRSMGDIPRSILPSEFVQVRTESLSPEEVGQLRAVGEQLLGDIHGTQRADMLEHCYVSPGEQGNFERTVQNLLRDSEQNLRDLEQAASSDGTPIFDGQPNDFVRQVASHENVAGINDPVLIVGHVGAGKTTFLHKSIAALREQRTSFFALLDFEGRGRGGAVDAEEVERWTAQQLLKKLGTAASTALKNQSKSGVSRKERLAPGELKHADPESPEMLRTILKVRLARMREQGKALYDLDPHAWAKKEVELFEELQAQPVEHLTGFIHQLHKHFRRGEKKSNHSVLVVLDNLDQTSDEYQRCVYGFAQRLARDTPAVVVLCLRESTYAEGKSEDGFLSGSPLTFVFHVQAPSFDRLIRQRVKYGRFHLGIGKMPSHLRASPEGLEKTCEILESSLLPPRSEAVEVIAALAGHNMRRGLAATRAMLEGAVALRRDPTTDESYLLDCFLAISGEKSVRQEFGLINLFKATPAATPLHALPSRLLAYYSFARETGNERPLTEATERVVSRFAAWGYPPAMTTASLRHLYEQGALQSPSTPDCITDVPSRLQLTASGHVHLTRLIRSPTYRSAMALLTRWHDQELGEQMVRTAAHDDGTVMSIAEFLSSGASQLFDAYLAKTENQEDSLLSDVLEQQDWVRQILARTGRRNEADDGASPTHSASSNERGQMHLIPEAAPDLPALDAEATLYGTKYVPRILWGLEWARLSNRGPISAAEIARQLEEGTGLNVAPNNIARAFRDFKDKKRFPNLDGLWTRSGKKYSITPAGSQVLTALCGGRATSWPAQSVVQPLARVPTAPTSQPRAFDKNSRPSSS